MYLTDENLEELFARRGEELYIYFRGQVNDRQDALDLVAETFSRATLNRSKCRGVTFNEMERWIQGIAGNALKEHYGNRRKRRHAMEQLRVQHILLADSTLPAELSDNDMLAVDRWLNQIHPHYAEAVRRRVLEDQSYPQISRELDISEDLARQRVSRGITQLRTVADVESLEEASANEQ